MAEKFEIRISVRNLVEFIMKSGDLDNRVTGKMSLNAMAEGSRIHRKIQSRMGSHYQAEVPLKLELEYDDFRIRLEGRADGVMTGEDGVTVDEIKGVYQDVTKMKQPVPVHFAQAMCYAYIYALQNGLPKIGVWLTYCQIEEETVRRFQEEYTFEEVEAYFMELIEAYLCWARYLAREKELRDESIRGLSFPFDYRKGQKKIVVSVYKAIQEKRRLFVQAPTGVGKTISTVFPSIHAIGSGLAEKIFYLTAKTITRTVAEEAFDILRERGLHFKTVTITAKEKICVNDPEALVQCNPVRCSRARGHFDRVNRAIFDLITHESSIKRETILEYAEKYQVCPFEMSLDVSNFMDGVICDYNYVFDPHARLKRYFADGASGDYIFLVDEAHNLVERARSMYSATLVKEDFLAAKRIMKSRSKKISDAFEKCNREMLHLKHECIGQSSGDSYTILNETEDLVLRLLRISPLLEKYLDENKEFEGREEILTTYFQIRYYLDVYELIDEKYEIYSDFASDGSFYVKLFCVNPSGNLSACLSQGIAAVFFSATLLPVNYYKELLSGDLSDYAIYIESPFDPANRLLAIAKDVSSRYNRRGREEYGKILTYIRRIAEGCPGNYMVFFPSYKLMEEVFGLAVEEELTKQYEIICQTSGMDEEEREAFLQRFEEKPEGILLGFCVLGGIFSEGIDLKNERLIGSIIVGTGLPQICQEREILRNHYEKNGKNGFDYAYRFPGMNKVMQAAGRVIRTKEDVGVVALLDDRFFQREYQMIFPREWNCYEAVDMAHVHQSVKQFWEDII